MSLRPRSRSSPPTLPSAPADDRGPPRLSYSAHPAVVHKIARFACARTKLALRATCRTLRLRLDPEIFEHAVLTADERLRSAEGYLPAAPLYHAESAFCLSYIRVLDLHAPPGPGFARAKAELCGLEMVRGASFLSHGPDLSAAPFECRVATMVDRVHLCGPPPAPILAGRAHKHVFNVQFDPTAEHIPHASLSFQPSTAHLVFIFAPHCTSGQRVARAHNPLCSVLGRILTPVWRCTNSRSVTFVGLAELDRRSLGLPTGSSSLEVEEAVRAALGTVAFQEPIMHSADLSNFLATVRFFSRAAYRAAVGERAYALETGIESTKPALDHTSYPHILERVVALAPWQSMLRLRQISRGLKARADAAFFHHITVLPGSLPYLLFVRGAGGRLPATTTWDARHDCLVPRPLRPLFAHTRVLDIPFELDESIATLVADLLPNLRVVRSLSPKHTQLMSTVTEVHYRPLAFFRENVVRFPNASGSGSRLVVAHLYDAARPTASVLPSVSSARGQPGEVVLLFMPFVFPSSAPARPLHHFLDDVDAYIVAAVCRRRMGREAARLTLVGVGEMVAAASASASANAAGTTCSETGANSHDEAEALSLGPHSTHGPHALHSPHGPHSPHAPHSPYAPHARQAQVLLDADLADGRAATALLQRAFAARGAEWRVPSLGAVSDNLRFVSRAAYENTDTAWETEAPALAALYAAGWTQ
ncbi:hypothetical protein CspeluHIS016_0501020 [Cutaneotrichosporon spelunceum]|uniref:F-box domain-containing protein n=1 Tax=Cutaneotrichosporon spelunceum TaxID=1672016 RepID=A0AAD3YCG0_9TREE|nr:hypothetical protein CspeluHIS016_0501020 [Cutaneotrichosporon spelunceum]